ncbi:MAG TPA: Crp/Fnr family transcriptional regulator [Allosphingosinicella sp.]|jgi:CRP-like cAMP-binding protein|nr:Crp/Fnr family transcriptional regulator [Allosphingosinicella sp.]
MPAEMADSAAAEAIAGLLLKLRARDVVTGEEEEVLRASVAQIQEFPAGRTIVRSGTTLSASTLLVDGIVCRYKDLADGQRQIMELHVAGDFVDLHGFLLKQLDHNVGTMTAVRVATFPHDALRGITETHPHLGRMLWFSTLLDAAIHREKILSIGRRSALARIAHIFCELFVRLRIAGLASADGYALPLTQVDLADVTSLTSVHVNRMLKKLRDDDLLTFRGGTVTIGDWDRLQRLAEFDPTYLHLERRPR